MSPAREARGMAADGVLERPAVASHISSFAVGFARCLFGPQRELQVKICEDILRSQH